MFLKAGEMRGSLTAVAARAVSCGVEGVRALSLGVLGVMYSHRTALVYESSMMVRHSVNGVT